MNLEDIEALPDGSQLVAPNGDVLTIDRYMPTPVMRCGDGSYLFLHHVEREYDLATLKRLR